MKTLPALKIIHILALGLWFGGMTFFSFFTALPVIRHMEQLAASEPDWLPGVTEEKQGTRLAGEALAPVFARYFLIQVLAGSVALVIALAWSRVPGFVHKVRSAVLAVALLLALLNLLWLAPKVSELRVQRYVAEPAIAKLANEQFGPWHTYSLLTDMATWLLAGIGLAMASALPQGLGTRD